MGKAWGSRMTGGGRGSRIWEGSRRRGRGRRRGGESTERKMGWKRRKQVKYNGRGEGLRCGHYLGQKGQGIVWIVVRWKQFPKLP